MLQAAQGWHKRENFPLSNSEQELPLFAFSAHFCGREVTGLPKAGIFLVWEDWGEGPPHPRLFCCYLVPHSPCRCTWHRCAPSPPVHLDLSPPYLCDSQMGLDCLIRRRGGTELSRVKLHLSCCQATDLCPTDTLGHWAAPCQPGLQGGTANAACSSQSSADCVYIDVHMF